MTHFKCRDNACTTKTQGIESLITHGITDKAACLSKAKKVLIAISSFIV